MEARSSHLRAFLFLKKMEPKDKVLREIVIDFYVQKVAIIDKAISDWQQPGVRERVEKVEWRRIHNGMLDDKRKAIDYTNRFLANCGFELLEKTSTDERPNK